MIDIKMKPNSRILRRGEENPAQILVFNYEYLNEIVNIGFGHTVKDTKRQFVNKPIGQFKIKYKEQKPLFIGNNIVELWSVYEKEFQEQQEAKKNGFFRKLLRRIF